MFAPLRKCLLALGRLMAECRRSLAPLRRSLAHLCTVAAEVGADSAAGGHAKVEQRQDGTGRDGDGYLPGATARPSAGSVDGTALCGRPVTVCGRQQRQCLRRLAAGLSARRPHRLLFQAVRRQGIRVRSADGGRRSASTRRAERRSGPGADWWPEGRGRLLTAEVYDYSEPHHQHTRSGGKGN